MKRTPLKRKTPMRRAPFRGKASGKSSYRRRERDLVYMAWVLTQPCLLRSVADAGPCYGRVQADHAGARALGKKAPDNTCIPLCLKHHHDRTVYVGYFKDHDAKAMRAWCDWQVAIVQVGFAAREVTA